MSVKCLCLDFSFIEWWYNNIYGVYVSYLFTISIFFKQKKFFTFFKNHQDLIFPRDKIDHYSFRKREKKSCQTLSDECNFNITMIMIWEQKKNLKFSTTKYIDPEKKWLEKNSVILVVVSSSFFYYSCTFKSWFWIENTFKNEMFWQMFDFQIFFSL